VHLSVTLIADGRTEGLHVLDGSHNPRARPVLEEGERRLNQPYDEKDDSKSQVSNCRWATKRLPADENQNAACQKQRSKATKKVADGLAKPSGARRGEGIATVLLHALRHLRRGETACDRGIQTLEQFVSGDFVPIEFDEFYKKCQ